MVNFKQLASMTPEEREEYREQQKKRDEEFQAGIERDEKEYLTFLTDARKSARLSKWEIDFIASMEVQQRIRRLVKKADLSEKQMEVVKRIEKKIYAAG